MPLHNHLLLNGYTYSPPTSCEDTVIWMAEFVKKIGMKTLQGPFASYVDVEGNKGLTCVVMIETSHIAMHVWDEPVPAKIQFDLYTCGTLEEDFALQNIIDFLKLEKYEYMVLERESGFNIIKEDSTS